jgi:DNA-directed RNA polymerase specialized sigma24 family protein
MVGNSEHHIQNTMQQAFASARGVAEYHAKRACIDPDDLLHDAWRFLSANAARLAREGRDGMSFNAVVEFFGRRAVQAHVLRTKITHKYAKRNVDKLVELKEPVDQVVREEMFAEIMAEVERLCPKYRNEVKGLLEGLSIQELAIRLNQPTTTIESRVARAKRRLATSSRLLRMMQLLLCLPPFALLLRPRKTLAQSGFGGGKLVAASCVVALVVTFALQADDADVQAPSTAPIQFETDVTAGGVPSSGAVSNATPVVGVRAIPESTPQGDGDAPAGDQTTAASTASAEPTAGSTETASATSEGFLQEYVEYFHDTGTVKMRYTKLNGKLHGIFSYYHKKNGILWTTTPYVHGVIHGEAKDYQSNGIDPWRIVTYENGVDVKWEKVAEDDN